MTVVERFLKYVTYGTQSSETSGTTPSTRGQRIFAEALVNELRSRPSVSFPTWIPVRTWQAMA